MPFKDPEKKRIYAREQARRAYAADPEKRKAYMKKWRAKHPEKGRAAIKAWREKNPDKVVEMAKQRKEDPVRNEARRTQNREHKREYLKSHPDRIASTKLKAAYGITLDDYKALSEKQNHLCAICGSPTADTRSKRLHVDHCHISKKVRGLLCGNCNNGLGRFKHDVAVLEQAVRYLQAVP